MFISRIWMFKRGIKQKLILSLVVTTLVLMLAFFVALNRYLDSHSIKEAEKTVYFLGDNASSLLQKALFQQDYQQLETIVRPIILENFDYIVVYDKITQNIAFVEDKIGITRGFQWKSILGNKKQREKSELDVNNGHYTQYLFPVYIDSVPDEPLGYLVIGLSEQHMKAWGAGITNRIFVICGLLFISLVVTIYLSSDRIVKPLKKLSANIAAFAAGDYSVRSTIKTNDEINDLADNFNFMADKINEQIISIEKYSKNLENMVEERTRELLVALDAIKEKDKKLNQAEKLKSLNSLVSSIAHEINNPLAIISGNLQLVEARVDNPMVKKKIKSAEEAIVRIADLINELHFFSTIKDISTQPMAFSAFLCREVERIVPGDIPVEITSGIGENGNDELNTNERLLILCLQNILRNSVEVIQERKTGESGNKGQIRVNYYKESPYFVIEIVDNGGGFEDPKKAFDPFYSTREGKKGLGLTFVHHVIQTLSGDISVENTGDGAKVNLMLPMDIYPEDDE